MALKLMYITNRPETALIAEKYGVDRIWVDLETLGKEERQKGRDSVKSNHTIKDISSIAPLLKKSEMLVRINPWNEKSVNQINAVIDAGADMVMLPMWKTVDEVKKFICAVGGRSKTTLLLERKEAEECLDDVLNLYMTGECRFDEIHIGLNDLHISYNLTFMFELLTNGTIEKICKKIKAAGIPYGFGGIAKIGDGDIPAEKIVLEHYRLGSTRAILSRSFCDSTKVKDIDEIDNIFKTNMKKLRDFEKKAEYASDKVLRENQLELIEDVNRVLKRLKKTETKSWFGSRCNYWRNR